MSELKELFRKYIDGIATDKEIRQLMLLLQDEYLRDDFERIIETHYEELPGQYELNSISAHRIFKDIVQPQTKQKKSVWRQMIAAAVILVMLGWGIYHFWIEEKNPDIIPVLVQEDVAPPDKNRSYLVLANNQVIYLDSVSGGILYEENGMRVVKTEDGRILYEGNTRSVASAQNMLNNPKGSKVIDIILSDGTQVWLNAGASITYPVTFTENERRVNVSGEVYLEVVSNESKPFYVNYQHPSADKNGEVRVTGTRFNVYANAEEPVVKVTLLEGKIQVKNLSGNQYQSILPLQQATVSASGIEIQANADTEAVMAWKNGFFQFKNTSIQSIMQEVSRWYDVEIQYEGEVMGEFYAEISRDVAVSKLLKMLELTGRVHFEIKDKTIIVKP